MAAIATGGRKHRKTSIRPQRPRGALGRYSPIGGDRMRPARHHGGSAPTWGHCDGEQPPMRQILLLAALALPAAPVFAADAADNVDKKLRKLLDRSKISYEVDADGDFKVTYNVGNGRTQLAFVRSKTFGYGQLRIREILSIGYRADGDAFPAEVANRMLEHNNDAKMGAWAKQGNLAIFTTKIAADAGPKELASAIEVTVSLADELERELSGKADEF